MSYHLEGRLLEVCNCNVLCPCWIGEDPDGKTCDTIVAWRIDSGRAPIRFTVNEGKGELAIGTDYYAELEPYRGTTGGLTTLSDTVFSTVPGAPVFVGRAPAYRSKNEALGIDLDLKNHNALQSTFVFDA